MTDETNETNTETENSKAKTYTEEELNAIISAKDAELEAQKQKVNEFRENNIKFLREKEELERQALEKKALADNDIETYKKSIAEREEAKRNELLEQIKQKDALLLGSANDKAYAELGGLFLNPEKGKRLLNGCVDTRYVDNKPVTFYKDGNFETTDFKLFQDHLSSNPIFQSDLRGLDFKGGGASETNNSGAVNIKNTAAEDAKKKGDVAGFLKAKMNQKGK